MDAYLVIGNNHTRKSSLVRCLSGCFNRSVRDIQLINGRAPMRLYARAGAAQETRKSPETFVTEVLASRCAAVLCCLLPTALPNEPDLYPDAQSYIAHFEDANQANEHIAPRTIAARLSGRSAARNRSPFRLEPEVASLSGLRPERFTARRCGIVAKGADCRAGPGNRRISAPEFFFRIPAASPRRSHSCSSGHAPTGPSAR